MPWIVITTKVNHKPVKQLNMQTRILGFNELEYMMMTIKWNIIQTSYQSKLKKFSIRMKYLTCLEV